MKEFVKFNLIGTIFLFHLVLFSNCVRRIRRFTTDIHDPSNWIVMEDEEDCDGLIFPDYINGAPQLINFSVKQIILPNHGTLLLPNNSVIGLNENSEEKINCAVINSTNFNSRNWADLSAWITEGMPEVNPAVPDMERLPCQYDDVVLPAGLLTSSINAYFYSNRIRVKSFTFGSEKWTNDDLINNANSEIFQSIFVGNSLEQVFDVKEKDCTDPTGCICGNDGTSQSACWYINAPGNFPCLDEIQPNGFCQPICGAYILFKPMKNIFKIGAVREVLKDYQSYSYVSKVEVVMSEYIQVVFTEKEFSGASIDEAQHLYQRFLNEPNFGARRTTLTASRVKPYHGTSIAIVFGTFLAVLVMFGLLFLVSTPKSQGFIRDNVASRLNLNFPTSRSTFTSTFMAKYKRADDMGPFVDTQSIAESVVSLEKSFENPLFGQSAPSTSTASFDKNVPTEERPLNSEFESENPLFDMKGFVELRDIAENGELVDLTDN